MPEKDPYEPVRVKDKDTGYHLTIYRMNLLNGNYQELKQDATDASGKWLPPNTNPGDDGDSTSAKKES